MNPEEKLVISPMGKITIVLFFATCTSATIWLSETEKGRELLSEHFGRFINRENLQKAAHHAVDFAFNAN